MGEITVLTNWTGDTTGNHNSGFSTTSVTHDKGDVTIYITGKYLQIFSTIIVTNKTAASSRYDIFTACDLSGMFT